MRFEPSEEAAALRAAVEAQLRVVTPAVVRAGWPDGDQASVREAWRKLAAGGVIGALVAADAGGLGLDEEAVVHALEAIGYAGLPVPAVETVAVGAPLLAAAGTSLLDDVLSGAAVVAVPAHPAGAEPLLPFGQTCDAVVMIEGGAARSYMRGDLDLEPVASIDGARRLTRVIARRGGTVLTDDPALVERAALRGALGTAAVLNGLSRRMLDMTVDYVKHREQFGVPVGSFQAIKHALASALVALSFARPPVYTAGWALAHGADDVAVQVALAKAMAGEAALGIARTAIQCHGAIAYTTEYDLHLFAKRVWALVPAWGDAHWHRARIATHIGLSAGTER